MKNAFKASKYSYIILSFIACLVLMICGFTISYKDKYETVLAEGTQEKSAVVYDYYDLTGDYFRSNTVTAPMFVADIAEKDIDAFSVKIHVRIINDNHNHIAFGILLPENAQDSWATGYWFGIDKNKGFAVAYTNLGAVGDNIFNVSETDRIGSHAKMSEMYAPEGFIFEYGTQTVENGRLIYVKVNGETVLEEIDAITRDSSMLGTRIVSDTTYRCDFSTAKDITSEVESLEAESIDYYDLTGNIRRENTFADTMLFGTVDAMNFEFVSRLALSKGHRSLPIGICAIDNGRNDTYTHAYWLEILNDGTLNLYNYGWYGDGTGIRAVASKKLSEETQAEDGFILNYGVKHICLGEDFPVGRYLYVTVNGKMAISWTDYSIHEIGGNILADTTGRATLTSSYINWDDAVQYDWYDITGEFATTYDVLRKDLGTELSVGQFPSTQTINISMVAKLTVEDAVWSDAGGINFSILKATDIVNEQLGTGYNFKWKNLFELSAGNWYGDGFRGGTAAYKNFEVKSGDTFDFEFGAVKCYFKGEYYGTKAFVNVDGREVISLIDKNPSAFDGSYITAPVLDAEKETVLVSTSYPTRTFLCEKVAGVDLENSITVLADEEIKLFIPMQIGYILNEVKLDGQNIDFAGTKGGYILTIPETISGNTLTFTTAEKKLVVTLPTMQEAVFEAQNEIPYGGTVTLSVKPIQGKILTSLTINGTEVKDKLTLQNGTYIYTEYTVHEDMAVAAVFEDKTFTVTKTAGVGGRIDAVDTIAAGANLSIVVVAEEGYYISFIKINGQSVSFDEDGKCTVNAVSEDITIEAEFAAKPIEESSDSGCSGSLTGGVGILSMVGIAALCIIQKGRKKND